MSINLWVMRHLKLNISDETIKAFDALSEEEQHTLLKESDDAIRMVLMCMERVLMHGGRIHGAMHYEVASKALRLKISDQFYLSFDVEEVSFPLNYYGQMQLNDWLLGSF